LRPDIVQWSGKYLVDLSPSGSFAKGTANKSGTDIDVFVSLAHDTPETLKDIYTKLLQRMAELGYKPKAQNVSINITVHGYDVDLVPAKRQDFYSHDHSLYRRKADTWTKTNVATHISYVSQSGRVSEGWIFHRSTWSWLSLTPLPGPTVHLRRMF
jgi:predicted nucleotidyltransferase